MQLSNASVDSVADGVLTLSFVQTGFAKGFLTGGYDKVLSEVLTEMFGATPTITTSVGAPAGSPPRSTAPDSSDSSAAQPNPRGSAAAPQRPSPRGASRRPERASAADNEPAPGDLPAPDALTGTDLIERELGGRIIEELGGP